jgi:hypothetical protein
LVMLRVVRFTVISKGGEHSQRSAEITIAGKTRFD